MKLFLYVAQAISLYFPITAYVYIGIQRLYIYWGTKEYLIASAIQIVFILIFCLIDQKINKTEREKQEEIEIKAIEEFLEKL